MSNPILRLDPASPSDSPAPISLPIEVQSQIIKLLDIRELGSCALVSRDFYHTVIPLLYWDVSIDLTKDTKPILVLRKPVIKTVTGLRETSNAYITGAKLLSHGEEVLKWRKKGENENDKDIKRKKGIEIVNI